MGIGANTAVFSLANAAFFRPLPYPNAERLAFLWQNNQRTGQTEGLVAYPNFADWRSQSSGFSDMAVFMSGKSILAGDGGENNRTPSALVSTNFFSVLGVEPVLGRSFDVSEDVKGHADVVVISYNLWRTRFASAHDVLGRALLFAGGDKKTIIGVMPMGFDFPESTELWSPREVTEFLRTKSRQYPNQHVIGRLNTGVGSIQAQAELNTIADRLAKEYPDSDTGVSVSVVPMRQQLSAKVRQAIILLGGAIAGVLLIGCVNVANLCLVRAAGRQKEISIRYALGATRATLVKEFLIESVLLAAIAAGCGIILAVWIVRVVSKLNPNIAELGSSILDARVLGYTFGVAMFTAVLCGLLPLLSYPQIDLNRSLRETSGQAAPKAQAVRKLFIATQVALAFVLLVISSLLVRSLWEIFAIPPGFDAEHVLTLHVYWPNAPANATGESQRNSLYEEIMIRLRALPGVTGVGATSNVLFPNDMYKVNFVAEGHSEQITGQQASLLGGDATSDYFRTMSIPLLRGRTFNDADASTDAAPVVIINNTLAQRYWPNEDPTGHRIKFGDSNFPNPWLTVVGVVGDVRQDGLETPVSLTAYSPSSGYWNDDLVLRCKGDPRELISVVRQEVRDVNSNLVVDNIGVLSDLLSIRETQRRFNALLLGGLATVALLLSAIGIYGTISYWVRQRTVEIGIRMMLGADRQNISRLVLRTGMPFVLIGLLFGIGCGLIATKLIANSLYGVAASDPVTYLAISVLLCCVAFLACWVPAQRAVRVDPLSALRHE